MAAAGIDMCEMDEFKRSWLREYLSTHPKYQGQEITEALVDKWMDGVDKGNYVSNKSFTLCSNLNKEKEMTAYL